jgi:3-polyprenyl-4-hydroxybenzoate decarboxylase
VDDIVNHVVARALDQFSIDTDFIKRWAGEMRARVATLEPKT